MEFVSLSLENCFSEPHSKRTRKRMASNASNEAEKNGGRDEVNKLSSLWIIVVDFKAGARRAPE